MNIENSDGADPEGTICEVLCHSECVGACWYTGATLLGAADASLWYVQKGL